MSNRAAARVSQPTDVDGGGVVSRLQLLGAAVVTTAVAATVATIGSVVYVLRHAFDPSPVATREQVAADGGTAVARADQHGIVEYFEFGEQDGAKVKATLVALHGAQTTGRLFSILHDWALQKGVRIIAPTLPGFGLSTFPVSSAASSARGRSYTTAEWVAEMQALLHGHLRLTHFHVLGTSFGSIHAAALAGLYSPQQAVGNVELYVAIAPPATTYDPLEGSVLQVFAKMAPYPLFKRLFEKYIVRPLLLWFVPKDGDVARAVRTQWEGMATCADIIGQPWLFDWTALSGTGRKVVIVSCRQDNAAPPHNQKRLHENIPGSELVEYDGKHESGIENPAQLAAHLELILF